MADDLTDTLPEPERVKPRAWAIFLDNGNARMWGTLQPHVQKLADAEGLEVTPLYDMRAIAPTADELDRLRAQVAALQAANAAFGKRQQWWNDRMFALEAERDALQAENAALRADAERYRWLRDVAPNAVHLVRMMPGEMDQAVDAARGAKKGSDAT